MKVEVIALENNNGSDKDTNLNVNDGCKTFFLTTLGYHQKNDRFIFEVLSKTPISQITPAPDKRGQKKPANFIAKEEVISHISSFHPQVAHYRREHAPNTLYLPSDISVSLVHKDFLEKYPDLKCSYDVYRCQLKKMKISFAKLGHEECETCEQFKLHGHKQDELVPDGQECQNWSKHINSAKESRTLYRENPLLCYLGLKHSRKFCLQGGVWLTMKVLCPQETIH